MSENMARTGVQMGASAINTLMQSSVKVTDLIQIMLDGPNGPLAQHVEKGGHIGEIEIPTACVEDIAIACTESNIPFQIAGKGNLCGMEFVTLQFRDYTDFKRDEDGSLLFDKNNKTIPIGGDRHKIELIIDGVMRDYEKTRKMKTHEANMEWDGTNTVHVTGLSIHEAQLYQNEAQRMGIESFLRYSDDSGKYNVEVKEAVMERINPNIPSVGENWLSHCVLLRSCPDVKDYLDARKTDDDRIIDCLEKAIVGEDYEPLTIYCIGTANNEQNCRSNITLDGHTATYTYFRQDKDGKLLDKMRSETYDLLELDGYQKFKEKWATIGNYATMDMNGYRQAIGKHKTHEQNNSGYDEIRKNFRSYENYLNGQAHTRRALKEIDKDELFILKPNEEKDENGNIWRAYEERVPNSDKVMMIMLDENHALGDDDAKKKLEENLRLVQSELKTTPASQFTSVPSYMKKEHATIALDENGQTDIAPETSSVQEEFVQPAADQDLGDSIERAIPEAQEEYELGDNFGYEEEFDFDNPYR